MNFVLALHEILHETKQRKKTRVVFKIDFEKAYNKVHWDFLIQSMEKAGFNEIWCSWIRRVMEMETVAVKLNNTVGNYFLSYKGVRQGDPLSPLLLNLAADVLTRMVASAQQNLLVTGIVEILADKGITIL
jgi:hypothetical protein